MDRADNPRNRAPEAPPPLPAVQQAVLDPATLEALFCDLAQCTQILAVVPKTAGRSQVQERSIALAAARTGLDSGAYRGVQIRYHYQSQEWCDTLMATPGGIRLVRIRMDEARASDGTV